MILVDTSVWVDHLRSGDEQLAALLQRAQVVMHPMVVGELACGNLKDRETLLGLGQNLPQLPAASDAEARFLLERKRLWGRGIGYIDIHLLAAVALDGQTRLWTRDKRLRQAAQELGSAFAEADT